MKPWEENRFLYFKKILANKTLVSLIFLLFIGVQTYAFAIKDKMHQRIPESLDHYAQAISIVISHAKFHLNGYTGYRNVYNALTTGGFDWDHHENPIVLNQAIQKAREVSDVGSEHLLFSAGDVGFIDYTRIAFTLFGYKVESLLDFYFLILFIQVAVFFMQFRKNDLAVTGLILFLLGQYIVVTGLYTAGYNLWTVHNNRFLSVLAILSIVHIYLLVLYQKSLKLNTFLGAAVQILIFVFILRCRSSAFWMLGPLFLMSAVAALGWVKNHLRGVMSKKLSMLADIKMKLWPVVIILATVFFSLWIKPYILNPEYYSEKTLANHTFWYPVYVGLAIDPTIRGIYGPRPDTGLGPEEYFRVLCHEDHKEDSHPKAQARQWLCSHPDIAKPGLMILNKWRDWRLDYTQNDQDGARAVLRWLRNNGKTEEYLYTFGPEDKVGYPRWFGQCDSKEKYLQYEAFNKGLRAFDFRKDFKWREMDKILGFVVKDAIMNHPFRVLKVVFITKPFFFFLYYVLYFLKVRSLSAGILILMTCGYLFFYIKELTLAEMQKFLVLLFAMFAFSMIVTLTAYPAPHTISDQAVLLTTCILGLILYFLKKKWSAELREI